MCACAADEAGVLCSKDTTFIQVSRVLETHDNTK
jgi:hypothetical protein